MEPNPNIMMPGMDPRLLQGDPANNLPPIAAGAQVVQVNVVPADPIIDKINALIEAVNEFDDKVERLCALIDATDGGDGGD